MIIGIYETTYVAVAILDEHCNLKRHADFQPLPQQILSLKKPLREKTKKSQNLRLHLLF